VVRLELRGLAHDDGRVSTPPQAGEPEDRDEERLRELVAAAQQGDDAARGELLTRHLPALRAFVRLQSDSSTRQRESASDLVQTVCREVLEGLDAFRWDSAAGFRSWLYTVAHNKVRTRMRFWNAARRSPRAEHAGGDELLLRVYGAIDTASQVAIHREEVTRLEEAFAELSEAHRQIILQSRLMGLKHKEIAARMGRSEEAVRSLLSRALVALSAKLDRAP